MPHQKPMKWPLPDVVHPPDSVCFQIMVPNERHYIGAFYGAMFLLSKPYAWGDDPAHTAIEVGAVWRAIFDDLIAGNCPITPPAAVHGGILEDFEMPLRVDCDCNVWITCCDGTEKQLLTADQVRQLVGGQPGTDTTIPGAGECATIHGTTGAAAPWYLPPVVSDGDTLELLFSSGAWNDGGEVAWRLSNGDQFFNGQNVGNPFTSGTDPLPSANHMAMLALIDGSYYDLSAGVVTVPGGVSNAQVLILPNDDVLTNNAGEITFDIKVCNNQPVTWQHTFNFQLNTQGWSVRDEGAWAPGSGFVDGTVNYPPNIFRGADIQMLAIPAFTMTRLQVNGQFTAGSAFPVWGVSDSAPGAYFYSPTPADGPFLIDTGIINAPGVTDLYVDIIAGHANGADPGGDVLITSIVISGQGVNPF